MQGFPLPGNAASPSFSYSCAHRQSVLSGTSSCFEISFTGTSPFKTKFAADSLNCLSYLLPAILNTSFIYLLDSKCPLYCPTPIFGYFYVQKMGCSSFVRRLSRGEAHMHAESWGPSTFLDRELVRYDIFIRWGCFSSFG